MNFKKLSYIFFALIFVSFLSCSGQQQTLLSSDKDITAFSFPQGTGTITDISPTVGSIAVTVPYGTNLTALVATFTITGDSVAVSGIPQVSGTTPNNFTSPVHYIVTAQDASTKDYTVTVTVAGPTAGSVAPFIASGVTFNMVYVPGGLTTPTLNDDSIDATIANPYWIGQTEVTYQLWYTVITWGQAHGYVFGGPTPPHSQYSTGKEGNAGTPNAAPVNILQPVTGISWREAMVWTNALTEWYNSVAGTNYTLSYFSDAAYAVPIKQAMVHAAIDVTAGTQDNPYIKSNATGFRIPTHDEWELAARYKGNDSSNGAIEKPAGSGYYWTPGTYASGSTSSVTNNAATQLVAWCGQTVTHDVETKQANALGIYDMNGNVMEWVFDWASSNTRYLCSSTWDDACNVSYIGCIRGYGPNGSGYPGFRLVKNP